MFPSSIRWKAGWDENRQLRAVYRDEKTFYQQRQMLIKTITLPATWLDKSKVYLPEDDYRRLLDTIISAIRKHGDLANRPPLRRLLPGLRPAASKPISAKTLNRII
jgi:hypothetical protein